MLQVIREARRFPGPFLYWCKISGLDEFWLFIGVKSVISSMKWRVLLLSPRYTQRQFSYSFSQYYIFLLYVVHTSLTRGSYLLYTFLDRPTLRPISITMALPNPGDRRTESPRIPVWYAPTQPFLFYVNARSSFPQVLGLTTGYGSPFVILLRSLSYIVADL